MLKLMLYIAHYSIKNFGTLIRHAKFVQQCVKI